MIRLLSFLAVVLLSSSAPVFAQLPIPSGDTRGLFLSLVANRPFGQRTLLEIAPTLAQYCIALTPPNAAGDRTKIGDPVSGRWIRVGFGEGDWVWIVQGDTYSCVNPPTPPPPTPPLPPPPNLIDLNAQLAAIYAQNVVTQQKVDVVGAAVEEHRRVSRDWVDKTLGFFKDPRTITTILGVLAGRFVL